MPAFLEIIWYLALAGAAAVIGCAIVDAIGLVRLGRWLRLDVPEDDR